MPPPKLTTWTPAHRGTPFDADHHNRLIKFQRGELAAPQTWTASDGTAGMTWNPDTRAIAVGGTLTLAAAPAAPASDAQLTASGQVKGFAVFAGATGGLSQGYNVASITRTAIGVYVVGWTKPFSTATYPVLVSVTSAGAAFCWTTNRLVTQITVQAVTLGGAAVDPASVTVVAFGTLAP